MRGAVVVAGVLALLPAGAATAAAPPVAGHASPAVVECGLTKAVWSGSYDVRDGHAVRATWRVATRFACNHPELHLDVHSGLLRDRRAVPGVDATDSCDASPTGSCSEVGTDVTRTVSGRLSGLWQLRVTVHLQGADAAVMTGDGCDYDAPSLTMTCEVTSRPVRLP